MATDRLSELQKEFQSMPFEVRRAIKGEIQRRYTPQELQTDDTVYHDRGYFNYGYDPDNRLEDNPKTKQQLNREFQQLRKAIPKASKEQLDLKINPLQELMQSGALSDMGKHMINEMGMFSKEHGQLPDSLREIEVGVPELELADGGRIGELEQENMELEYLEEAAMFERVKDEPGLQEFSLAAPAAKLKALSALFNTGASKLGAMIPQGAKDAMATAGTGITQTADKLSKGLPSIMQRRGGTGQGFEGFNKRRGGTKSRVNQNLDGIVSRFYAETRGGTDLGGASQYTIELLRASMPEIRAAAARTKQNPKEGLNRIIQLMDELE